MNIYMLSGHCENGAFHALMDICLNIQTTLLWDLMIILSAHQITILWKQNLPHTCFVHKKLICGIVILQHLMYSMYLKLYQKHRK